MINYFFVSCLGMLVGLPLAYLTDLDVLIIAAITSVAIIVFGMFFFPFGTALWLYFDHRVHPLRTDEMLIEDSEP